jgi:hypothetical protein
VSWRWRVESVRNDWGEDFNSSLEERLASLTEEGWEVVFINGPAFDRGTCVVVTARKAEVPT